MAKEKKIGVIQMLTDFEKRLTKIEEELGIGEEDETIEDSTTEEDTGDGISEL